VSFAELFSSDQLVTVESAGKSLSWRFIGAEEPIPTPTPTPEPTAEPVVTPEPIITLEPIITPEPIIGLPVEPEPDSEVSSAPEEDDQTDSSIESEIIPEVVPEATKELETVQAVADPIEPDTTEEPALELEVVPEATEEPVITPEPIDTPEPTAEPTPEPTVEPSAEPEVTPAPTAEPTPEVTAEPTVEPTIEPIEEDVFDTLIVSDAEVQQRIYDYFDWCIETDSKPSVAALATALGIDRRTLWEWEIGKVYAGTQRASLIKHAKSIMNATMEEMMQTGKINPVVGIFLMMNNMGYKDQSDVVITPNQPLGEIQDKSVIEAKYAELPNDD